MLKITDIFSDDDRVASLANLKNTQFTWKFISDNRAVFQSTYQLIIKKDEEIVFNSGIVESSDTLNVSFSKLTLESATQYTAELTMTDNYGEEAKTTKNFSTEVSSKDWQGRWIKPKTHIESNAPYLRKKFCLNKPVKHAMLYASGLGCAEYYINGKKITEDFMDPPMTNYDKEVLYRAYDITKFLQEKNAIVAWLGDGWYSQSRVWYWEPSGVKYGDVCLNAQLKIEYTDGSVEIIATDDTWDYKYSPIVLNNIYAGEIYDCRFETLDFADYDGDEDGWGKCIYDSIEKGDLVPCRIEPMHIYRKISIKKIYNKVGDGAWVLDFGENISGIIEISIPRAPRGAQYVMRYAETIDENYQLDYRSSGAFATQCIQQDTYIARGDLEGETWRPRFTIHGFRYVELTGFHKFNEFELGFNPDENIAVAYAISTDLKRTGNISVEHNYLMKMDKISINTFLANYQGFPMDCPVRERCGWLGDSQAVCNYAMMSFDLRVAYQKYLSDIRTQTDLYGVCQMISPGKRTCGEASSLWGAATIVLPYFMYKYYDDISAAKTTWKYMVHWVQHELNKSENYIISEGLGDWDPPGGNGHPRRMPVAHSSTMMFYEICMQMAELATVLGELKETVCYYSNMAKEIRKALNDKFYKPQEHTYGYLGSNGVALKLGLYPDGEYEALLQATLDLMKAEDYEIHTGIYSNKYLIPSLCRGGYGDEALKFLFGKNSWSFGTMIDDGATSVWESLDMNLIETNRTKGINSYNHPMHSSFMIFAYSEIAGITPIEAGFKRFSVKPCAFMEIPQIDITYDSPYGIIGVRYQLCEENKRKYHITVPANTTCEFTPIGKNEIYIFQSGIHEFCE